MSAAAPGGWTPRAIVTALAILAGGALTGCGQRGSLYLPTVPPLPAKPNEQTQPPSPDDVKPGAETASSTIPDTSGSALTLSPDDSLKSAPGNDGAAPARPASAAVPQAQ
jgi:predicted small lipoprotein YifL